MFSVLRTVYTLDDYVDDPSSLTYKNQALIGRSPYKTMRVYTDDLPFVDQPAYRASTSSAIFGLLMEPRYEQVRVSLCEYTAGPIFMDRTVHQAPTSSAMSGLLVEPCSVHFLRVH